jgi:Winged helix DNA-binding domain
MSAESKKHTAGAARELVRRRLRSQLLATTHFTRPADVVAWLGAVQAQDYLGALWAVGLRLVDARERDVERAIEERSIVRTWPLRGTLHFVAARDARWMLDLLAPRALAGAAGRMRALGIDERVVALARRTLTKHLEGDRRITRPAAYALLERAGIATVRERGLHLLWRLAHDGLLCFGPRRGRQQTFVLFDEWLPRAKRLSRDDALAELARRYFTGHGPATARDFAWWSGLTLGEARAAITLAGKQLIEEELLPAERHWSAASAPPKDPVRARERAYALPPFDEFLVGYTDRSAAIDAAAVIRPSAFSLLKPAIVVDGQVIASWGRSISGARVHFTISPFSPPTKLKTAAVERALSAYARFFELESVPETTRK